MAAAVADYRPAEAATQKVKKGAEDWTVQLHKNPDILAEAKGDFVRIGFAAESQDLLANAREKAARKSLDLIVANDITAEGSGFAVDTNKVVLIDGKGAG